MFIKITSMQNNASIFFVIFYSGAGMEFYYFMINGWLWLSWETLWTYKAKEFKTVCVPGGSSYRAYSEGCGSTYTG